MMGEAEMTWEGLVGLEPELVQLHRGDPDALAALLARYQNRLYRYLLRVVREPAAAEDLFQQTWLRVVEHAGRYDPRRSFEAWLLTLARHLAIDHLRRIRPESLDEPAAEESAATRGENLASPGPSPLDRSVARERAARLGAALADLPALYREVLTLRFEEEMKLEEIAEVTCAPLSTVKTRLRRGLEGLRRTLASRYPGETWQ
jgi:RNA polymerase sigma-70 factor (ECF subfamily)